MATALETYDALRRAVRHVPPGTEFRINDFDAADLRLLSEGDLRRRGVGEDASQRIAMELATTGDVSVLGPPLGVRIVVDRTVPGIIPGEGIRRSAGALNDDPQSMEDMLEELRLIRHGPEARVALIPIGTGPS